MPQLVELQPLAVVPTTDKTYVADNFEAEMVIKIGSASLGINSSIPTVLIKKAMEVLSNA